MKETYNQLDAETVRPRHRPWVLVIGGVSREGNRRARRASREAAARGLDVVWLDGYEECDPENPENRLPISELVGDGETVILGFKDAERRQFLNRLSLGDSRTRLSSGDKNGDEIGLRRQPRGGILGKVLRRANKALRGYLIWRRLRPTIRELKANSPAPSAIVYGDGHAVPTAWHTVRIWRNAPADMELLDT